MKEKTVSYNIKGSICLKNLGKSEPYMRYIKYFVIFIPQYLKYAKVLNVSILCFQCLRFGKFLLY